MTERNDVHEFFEQIAFTIMEGLAGHGVDSEVAECVAWEVADRIKKDWGGEQLYIPKGTYQEIYALHQEMYDRYNSCGVDVKDLAREYKRAVQATYFILRRVRARRKAAQPTLFDCLASDREIPKEGTV